MLSASKAHLQYGVRHQANQSCAPIPTSCVAPPARTAKPLKAAGERAGGGALGRHTQNSKSSSISAKPAADPLGVTWGSWQYSNRPTTRHPAGSSSTHLRRVVAAVSRGVCVATPRDGRMRAIAGRTSAHENLPRSRSISRSPDVHEIVLVGERIELTRVDSQRVSHRGVGAVDERKNLVDLAAGQGDGERVRPHDQRHDVWP